jgi:predicted oxidoreductase
MGIGGGWGTGPLQEQTRKDALVSVQAALDRGINFYDHANIYGRGRCEEAFSGVWKEHPGLRQRIVVQTKCGIRFRDDPVAGYPQRYDYSRDHILESVDGSLKRLKTDYVDILLLHRPDALVEPQEVAEAFDVLQHTGKVRFFGVSNHSPWQIELLRRSLRQPLVVNQLELNVVHNHLIDAGVNVNQGEPGMQADGTLEYCRLHDITVQAWAPMAHGRIAAAGEGKGGPRAAGAATAAAALAGRKGVSPEAILVAWLLRHPAGIQPIIGTTKPERIREVCKADDVELTREEWYELFAAGRGKTVA